jgi:hypothetical protein
MPYLRNGHAPGHVREVFLSAIDAYRAWEAGQPEPTVGFEKSYVRGDIPISKACTLVWNCTDIMPSLAVFELELAGFEIKRRTYAACARALHYEITKQR